MVVERFYDTALDDIPAHPNACNSILYKLFNAHDFSLIKYSVTHFIDLFIGLPPLLNY